MNNRDLLRVIARLLEYLALAEKRHNQVYPPQNKGQFVSFVNNILERHVKDLPVHEEEYKHLRQAFTEYAKGRTEIYW